jgi:hypothetical protein
VYLKFDLIKGCRSVLITQNNAQSILFNIMREIYSITDCIKDGKCGRNEDRYLKARTIAPVTKLLPKPGETLQLPF